MLVSFPNFSYCSIWSRICSSRTNRRIFFDNTNSEKDSIVFCFIPIRYRNVCGTFEERLRNVCSFTVLTSPDSAPQNRKKEKVETDLRAHRCRTSSGRCTSSRGWGPAPPSHMPPSAPPSCPSLQHQSHQLATHTNLILSYFFLMTLV